MKSEDVTPSGLVRKLFLLAVFLVVENAFAGSRPFGEELRVTSANSQYVARVWVSDTQETVSSNKYFWKFSLSAIRTTNGKETVIWACPYEFVGDARNGIISDDGSFFVGIDSLYDGEQPLVVVYRNGRRLGALTAADMNLVQTDYNVRDRQGQWTIWDVWTAYVPAPFEFVRLDDGRLGLILRIAKKEKGRDLLIDVEKVKVLKTGDAHSMDSLSAKGKENDSQTKQ